MPPNYVIWIVGAVLLVLSALFIVVLLRRFGPPPYRRAELLTRYEAAFYKELRRCAERRGLHVLAKVRMADLISVQSGTRDYQSWFNRISQKHADFVLCDPKDLEAALVVELDDKTHDRPDRRARDRFVDSAYAAAGIPIAHVHTERGRELEELLDRALR